MDMKNVIEERRSVNFFNSKKKIEEDIFKNIINLAVLAPSAFNLQPWELIAVESDEAKEKLFHLASNQPKIKEAPITLIVVGDLEGYKPENTAWSELGRILNNKEALENYQKNAYSLYGTTEERKVKFAESNAGLLAMSIMYAAKYYGVDSHAMSGIDFEGIRKAFSLDESKMVVMLISLGYFDESRELYPRRSRKGYLDIVKKV